MVVEKNITILITDINGDSINKKAVDKAVNNGNGKCFDIECMLNPELNGYKDRFKHPAQELYHIILAAGEDMRADIYLARVRRENMMQPYYEAFVTATDDNIMDVAAGLVGKLT